MCVSTARSAVRGEAADTAAAPSFDLRRLDLRRLESRGSCCGDVSAEFSEDGLFLISSLLEMAPSVEQRTQHLT